MAGRYEAYLNASGDAVLMPRPTRLYEQGRAITQWAPPKADQEEAPPDGGHWAGLLGSIGGEPK
jgi:hypothetical protein